VEKDKADNDAEEDVLAAASSSDVKLKPRLTMIEQQVCRCNHAEFSRLRFHFALCSEFAGR
jgi:hypothetical protein